MKYLILIVISLVLTRIIKTYVNVNVNFNTANPRSINKFINSTPKLPLAVNQNSNSLIYDIIDLYLLPDTAPEELDSKTLSANDKHNVQPALFASLHKGYHYFFGNDYLPSTCNSANDENTRVVLDMNMNMNDANTAIYHDENIENTKY